MDWKYLVKLIFEVVTIFNFKVKYAYGEYFFDTYVPSHVSYKIMEMNSKIFPEDIRINVTLTSISGTLLYSIDKNGNQLILTLYNEINERIKIEFRELSEFVTLDSLCKWELSKFHLMQLTIKISDKISIKCNQGDTISFNYGKLSKINEEYPIIKSTDKEAAIIFLMNSPQHEKGYPNNDQLKGCIHDVKYNGQSLSMTRSSKQIGNNCNKVCLNNICNDGECYETFSSKPICNCKSTLYNGEYCNSRYYLNDTIIIANHKNLRIFNVKLVLRNRSNKDLFYMENDNFKLIINREDSSVISKFIHSQYGFVQTILFNQSNKTNSSVVFMKFLEKSIYFQIFDGELNKSFSIPISLSIDKEPVNSVFISHETDMIYKENQLQYNWCSFNLHEFRSNYYRKCRKFKMVNVFNNELKSKSSKFASLKSPEINNFKSKTFIGILVIETVIGLIAGFGVIYLIYLKCKSKQKIRQNEQNEILLRSPKVMFNNKYDITNIA